MSLELPASALSSLGRWTPQWPRLCEIPMHLPSSRIAAVRPCSAGSRFHSSIGWPAPIS